MEIVPLTGPEGAFGVPWVEAGWQPISSAPTFLLGKSARGWVGVTTQAVVLVVEVEDPVHHNPHTGPNLWQGDSIQIGVDGRGDGARGMDPGTSRIFGPDDLALGLALTDSGPVGWIFFAEAEERRGSMPSDWFSVERRPDLGETAYRLEIPWEALGTPPGAFPTFGLAVQVNDSSPGDTEQRRHYWGRGADGNPRPGLFQALRPETPDLGRPVTEATLMRDTAWGTEHPAEVVMAVRVPWPTVLDVVVGQAGVRREIPADGRLSHWRVLVPPSVVRGQEVDLELVLRVAEGDRVLLRERFRLKDPEMVYGALLEVLDGVMARASHPVFADHVRSVKAMAATEWARMELYAPSDPVEADESLIGMESLRQGFVGECGEWQAYLDGRRSLLRAYLSPTDGSMQSYYYCLPRDWDTERSYPLFLELHGAGNPNPFAGITRRLGAAVEAMNLHGYSTPKTFAEIQRNGYWIHPHGRGNLGYRGIGETDIWEAYADFAGRFLLDPDRHYLYGFSMGGGGTWSLALRTPDRWAAIAILAGGTWREDPSVPLEGNINHLPVFIWCGEADYLFPQYEIMKRRLEAVGASMVAETTPGLGHNYHRDVQERSLNWMQEHVRQTPRRFQFLADTPEHSQAWGIRLKREPMVSAVPSFHCEIDGPLVRLETLGTTAVKIDAGPKGLGLAGTYTVIWNGAEVYTGDAPHLLLRDGAAFPFVPGPVGRWAREVW